MDIVVVNLFVNNRTFAIVFCEKYDFLLENVLAYTFASSIPCARVVFLSDGTACVPA